MPFRGRRWCCRSEPRQEPARTQTPLVPSPFWGNPAQHGAHPRAHTAVNKNQGSRVRGAYRNDCGWIECPNRLVGWGQPPGGARKPKKAPRGRRILFACTFLRFRGRAAGPAAPLWRAVGVLRLAPGFVMFFFVSAHLCIMVLSIRRSISKERLGLFAQSAGGPDEISQLAGVVLSLVSGVAPSIASGELASDAKA